MLKAKTTLVGLGALLVLTPTVKAEPIALNNVVGNEGAIEVAYDYNYCPPNTDIFRYGQTRNYAVWICATEGGTLYYVGQAKNPRRGAIALRIGRYTGERFVAVNANTRYIVTPSRLVVKRNGKTILNERIFQWQRGTGARG